MMGNIPVGNTPVQAWPESIAIVHVVEVVASVDLRGSDINILRPRVDTLKSKSMSESLCGVELAGVIDGVAIPQRRRNQREVRINSLGRSAREQQMSIGSRPGQ